MFVSKMQYSYQYTKWCNYRKAFVFKPNSNQLNMLVGYNFSFTRSLNTFYLKMEG